MQAQPTTKPVIRFYYTDRLFSQVLRHFLSLFAARLLGVPHIHYPYHDAYTNEAFSTLFDTRLIMDKEATYEEVLEMQRALSVQQWCDQTIGNHFHIQDLFGPAHIDLMRQAYRFTRHTPTFDATALNVAIHVRRGDIARYPTESRYTPMGYFVAMVGLVRAVLPTAHIHVYSDSAVDLGPGLRYHIQENLLETMHDMIRADVLVMSVGSNMSFFAGLMSRGIVTFDWKKLEEPFNAELNRYWSGHPHFLEPIEFQRRLKELGITRTE